MRIRDITIEEVTFRITYSVINDKGDWITPPYNSIDIEDVLIVEKQEINITKLLDLVPQLEKLLIVELVEDINNS